MRLLSATLSAGLAILLAIPAAASPLTNGNWYQVARMAPDGTVFDGNGELASDYAFGTFTSQNQSDDFARPFDVFDGMQILFITGNENVYAMGSYAGLRQVIDARDGDFNNNYTWDETSFGTNIGANVLSRTGAQEDPWISLVGSHSFAVNNASMLWGENDWPGTPNTRLHTDLMMANNGMNVFVSVAPVPVPASLPLLGGALALIGAYRWRTRSRKTD